MKFVLSYSPTSSNLVAITFLSILVIASFSSAAIATPEEKRVWNFQYRPAANAPSNCPTEEYLRTSLAANLDGQVPFEKDAPRSISVTIERTSKNVEARITVRGENGTVTADDTLHEQAWRCDQLAERIVFELQNIVDPLELPSTKASKTPSNHAPKNTNNSPQNDPTPPLTPKKPMKPKRSSMIPLLGLSLAAGSAWWNAPKTALSTTIGIEALWERIAIGIEGHYEYAWTVPGLVDSTAERTTVMIMGCGLYPWSKRIVIRGCGFGDFGKTLFEHQGDPSQTPYAPAINVGARISAAVWITSRFGVELRADAAYAIARPQVRMHDNRIWQMRPFTAALRIAFLGAVDIF